MKMKIDIKSSALVQVAPYLYIHNYSRQMELGIKQLKEDSVTTLM